MSTIVCVSFSKNDCNNLAGVYKVMKIRLEVLPLISEHLRIDNTFTLSETADLSKGYDVI